MRLIMLLAALFLGSAWAQEAAKPEQAPEKAPAQAAIEFKEGQHYEKVPLPERVSKDATAKAEVAEFFWYGCPHCYAFEPTVEKWAKSKPADVAFVRVPAMLNPRWHLHARAYYALEQMGELPRGHSLLFAGIHEQNRRLSSEDSIARFLASQGVNEKRFREAYSDPAVTEKLERAKLLGDQFAISGVPTVIINGEYMTSARMAGGYDQVIDVINYLTQKVTKQTDRPPVDKGVAEKAD